MAKKALEALPFEGPAQETKHSTKYGTQITSEGAPGSKWVQPLFPWGKK